jgi:hypothetical protein
VAKKISAGEDPVSPGVWRSFCRPWENASVEKSPVGASVSAKDSIILTAASAWPFPWG